MYEKMRTADVVRDEKYEERGWNEPSGSVVKEQIGGKITPIPFSEEEYKTFSLTLAKLALTDNKPELCSLYFELKDRAFYGNGYSNSGVEEDIERNLWDIGVESINKDSSKHY